MQSANSELNMFCFFKGDVIIKTIMMIGITVNEYFNKETKAFLGVHLDQDFSIVDYDC